MNFPPYSFTRFQEVDEAILYAFTSSSQEKAIQKLVIFTPTRESQHNLALVDLLDSGELSDTAVSSNQNMEQGLAAGLIDKRLYSEEFMRKLLASPVIVKKQQEARELVESTQKLAKR